jgi:hypothetical protein
MIVFPRYLDNFILLIIKGAFAINVDWERDRLQKECDSILACERKVFSWFSGMESNIDELAATSL